MVATNANNRGIIPHISKIIKVPQKENKPKTYTRKYLKEAGSLFALSRRLQGPCALKFKGS
jgi:hypothetical protein